MRRASRRATERGDIQPSNRRSKGPLPSLLDTITPSTHDALLIPPNGLTGRVKVRAAEAIQVLVRVIRVQQRDVRHVGHGGAEGRARAERVRRRALLLRDGLLRRGGTGGGTLERLGACLLHEPRSVRVAVLEVVD